MTLEEVKQYFGSCWHFHRQTGMSHVNYYNWAEYGFIPMKTQVKLQALTNGILKADYKDARQYDI